VLINTKDSITSSSSNEGRFAARIITCSAFFNHNNKKSYGVVEPLSEGALVLVAFLESKKNRPIILGQLHYPDSEENIRQNQYPLEPSNEGFEKREALKYLRVFPSCAYHRVDGEGNMEFVQSSKSFLTIKHTSSDPMGNVLDNHLGYDHRDLNEKENLTRQTIQTDQPNEQTPARLLYVHRTSFNDPDTTWTKIFIDNDGTFRLTRDPNNNTLGYITIDSDGRIHSRFQLDSSEHETGDNYSEVSQEVDGGISIKRYLNGKTSLVKIQAGGDILIQADNVSIDADQLNLSGGNARVARVGDLIESAGGIYVDEDGVEHGVTGRIISGSEKVKAG
jgi:hypothetical protein